MRKIDSGVRDSARSLLQPSVLPWLAPLLAAAALLFFRLADVPGLHRDEASFGLFAERIIGGLRPIRGPLSLYTAPMHSYVIALCFRILGVSPFSLRLSGVLLNLIAAGLYGDTVRRLIPGKAKWALWFLVSMPAFVIMSRFAGENYALNPLFFFGGIWVFNVLGSERSSRLRRGGCFLSGLCFGLGIWNHLVALPSVCAALIAYLSCGERRPMLSARRGAWGVFGAGVALAPKLYDLLRHPAVFAALPYVPPSAFSTAAINMVYALGGDGLYLRTNGEVVRSFNWVLPLVLLASGSVLFRRDVPEDEKRLWRGGAVCLALAFAGTWLITPAPLVGFRLWLLPIWLAPFLIAIALPSGALPRTLIGAAIIAINLVSVSLNFFSNFLRHRGIPRSSLYVGGRYDNSVDYVDMRALADKLSNTEGPIYIEDLNTDRLAFLLPRSQTQRVRLNAQLPRERNLPEHGLVALVQSGERGLEAIQVMRWGGAEGPGARVLARRRDLSTPQYAVFEVQKEKSRPASGELPR